MTTITLTAEQADLLLPRRVRVGPAPTVNYGHGYSIDEPPLRDVLIWPNRIDPEPCPECDGAGWFIDDPSSDEDCGLLCQVCHGARTVPATITIAVRCKTYGVTHMGGVKHGTGHCEHRPPCDRGLRPIGVATVKCLPIVGEWDLLAEAPYMRVMDDGLAMLRMVDVIDGGDAESVFDRIVGDPQPNTFALILTGAART